MTIWPAGALYIPKSVRGRQAGRGQEVHRLRGDPAGLRRLRQGTAADGPVPHQACKLPSDVTQVAKDTKAYFDSGKASPALEFKSPIKGPNLEQICIQVGTGQVSGAKGAALYDEDVKKQAQQLGLPGWDDREPSGCSVISVTPACRRSRVRTGGRTSRKGFAMASTLSTAEATRLAPARGA